MAHRRDCRRHKETNMIMEESRGDVLAAFSFTNAIMTPEEIIEELLKETAHLDRSEISEELEDRVDIDLWILIHSLLLL